MKDGYLLREEVKELKEKIVDLTYSNETVTHENGCLNSQVHHLQKRVDGFKAKANYMGGFNFVQVSRGSVDVCKVYQIERDQALKENEALKKRVKYLIERNNRFEVNEKYYDEEYRKLSDEKQTHEMVINGYKKELSQLNLLMDDMEDRLEKQVVARDGMLKQLREYKAEKKRMNKIIDALTEDK